MYESTTFTLIFGFRNRDTLRVSRCFESLKHQTFKNFSVIFVDYGSDACISHEIKTLLQNQYNFCEYLYAETRGCPWNRSHALNIGITNAKSTYIITSDIDIIFPEDFLATVEKYATPNKVLFCSPYWLPSDFTDWSNLSSYHNILSPRKNVHWGTFMCLSRNVLNTIHGFDEYYSFWGTEDEDIYNRLMQLEIKAVWLNNYTGIYHQWHKKHNIYSNSFMPYGLWGRHRNYFEKHKRTIVRNNIRWGHIPTREDRMTFNFLDFESNHVNLNNHVVFLDIDPYAQISEGKIAEAFWTLKPNHALAINNTSYPIIKPKMEIFLRLCNKFKRLFGISTPIIYPKNILYSYLIDFIEHNTEHILDYYLNFPDLNGISLLVRKA